MDRLPSARGQAETSPEGTLESVKSVRSVLAFSHLELPLKARHEVRRGLAEDDAVGSDLLGSGNDGHIAVGLVVEVPCSRQSPGL